ncbi:MULTISPECIES: GFA family protein [Xanthomonas]|uniref:GFA family protein n=1 Tax=Xanthomonas TaxID=338 RepID=UPI0006F2B941|nr:MULTISPECIES: GFA family protein [Xanthomonas]KQR07810.1 hypothetical protein ASF90_16715 [Xanthomonas sp. Leaf148]
MSRHTQPHLHGRCECGNFSFETSKAPHTRFICHCLFCQDFTGEAFSDVSVMWAHQITLKASSELVGKKYRLPPNLTRNRCPNCGKAAMETMGAGPLKLVFIPSKNFAQTPLLPAVRLHAFYNRRVRDVADGLPKHSHYWPSQLAISRAIMGL